MNFVEVLLSKYQKEDRLLQPRSVKDAKDSRKRLFIIWILDYYLSITIYCLLTLRTS
jgi:hypothetical protein